MNVAVVQGKNKTGTAISEFCVIRKYVHLLYQLICLFCFKNLFKPIKIIFFANYIQTIIEDTTYR